MADNFWGQLIKRLRIEQGVTQRKLAAEARVNRLTLRHIEQGETAGDVDILERLLAYLGYELDAIAVVKIERSAENSSCNRPSQC